METEICVIEMSYRGMRDIHAGGMEEIREGEGYIHERERGG